MRFEWHEQKAQTNIKKHGISFEEAVGCFYDPHQVAFEDPDHHEDELREILIGHSQKGRLLLVVYTVRGKTIRLISARLATKREAKDYAQGI
jgi:uncharacterized protein